MSPSTNTTKATKVSGQNVAGHNANDNTGLYFILPAVVWILLFTIFPLLYAVFTSFWSFRFGQRNQFVWFD
ncbi:MAG: hypothetical protein KDJ52_34345, partial [Anaerolineae bacterium]|nr:hypothetical protein [Anaerolineae bacterium]